MQINQKDCEYLVIGSGAGGAVAFKTLSAEGKNVLLIEEGKKWKPEDFNTPIGLQSKFSIGTAELFLLMVNQL